MLLYHVAKLVGDGRPGFAHGYLAVGFFFCLSGFVLAHAFERRDIKLAGLSVHPRGAIAGAAGAVDPDRRGPDLQALPASSWPNRPRACC